MAVDLTEDWIESGWGSPSRMAHDLLECACKLFVCNPFGLPESPGCNNGETLRFVYPETELIGDGCCGILAVGMSELLWVDRQMNEVTGYDFAQCQEPPMLAATFTLQSRRCISTLGGHCATTIGPDPHEDDDEEWQYIPGEASAGGMNGAPGPVPLHIRTREAEALSADSLAVMLAFDEWRCKLNEQFYGNSDADKVLMVPESRVRKVGSAGCYGWSASWRVMLENEWVVCLEDCEDCECPTPHDPCEDPECPTHGG